MGLTMFGRVYRVCSGQRAPKGTRDWGICRADQIAPWWRAEDKRGRMRRFSTWQAAAKALHKMERSLVAQD